MSQDTPTDTGKRNLWNRIRDAFWKDSSVLDDRHAMVLLSEAKKLMFSFMQDGNLDRDMVSHIRTAIDFVEKASDSFAQDRVSARLRIMNALREIEEYEDESTLRTVSELLGKVYRSTGA